MDVRGRCGAAVGERKRAREAVWSNDTDTEKRGILRLADSAKQKSRSSPCEG